MTAPEGTSGQVIVPVVPEAQKVLLTGRDVSGNNVSAVRNPADTCSVVLPVDAGGPYLAEAR